VYKKIREEDKTITRLCQAADVSRAGYYRFITQVEQSAEEMDLRDAIQKIAVRMPAYGYRRITAELRRDDWVVNRKRVLRIMREDNLLCLRRRSFVRTTDSGHKLPVYPNLAKELKVSGLNQLWVADITYIRLQYEFVYLAVILDAHSRRVIGWALGRTLEAELAVDALKMAIRRGRVEPGLVHHSDRGIQYASKAYTDLLREHGIQISMSRRGNPYDNAMAESFMKTLKYEEVYRTEYRDFDEARRLIGQFIESIYNQKRLHSALGYLPPVEFEQNLRLQAKLTVAQT
jgi:putative transposase